MRVRSVSYSSVGAGVCTHRKVRGIYRALSCYAVRCLCVGLLLQPYSSPHTHSCLMVCNTEVPLNQLLNTTIKLTHTNQVEMSRGRQQQEGLPCGCLLRTSAVDRFKQFFGSTKDSWRLSAITRNTQSKTKPSPSQPRSPQTVNHIFRSETAAKKFCAATVLAVLKTMKSSLNSVSEVVTFSCQVPQLYV